MAKKRKRSKKKGMSAAEARAKKKLIKMLRGGR
jgi:hypothetical protein